MLGSASCKRYGPLAQDLVNQHFWHNGRNVQDVHEGELTEQVVHGSVEAGVHVDENDHDGVAGYGDDKNQEDEGKEKPGEMVVAEQAQENKVSIHGIIAPLHRSASYTKKT